MLRKCFIDNKAQKLSKRLKQQEFVMQMVAHEMRTPLAIITQFIQMLQALISFKGEADSPEAEALRQEIMAEELTAEDLMSNIELQVNLLLSFCNDLLDLAKIDEGFFKLEQAEFSFPKVLHETYLMFKRHADMQGKKLIYSINKSMPEMIYGDQMRLQ